VKVIFIYTRFVGIYSAVEWLKFGEISDTSLNLNISVTVKVKGRMWRSPIDLTGKSFGSILYLSIEILLPEENSAMSARSR
jgi:hypothetical protein